MKGGFQIIAAIAGCAIAVGCASGSGLLPDESLVELEIGASHQSQVLESLGPPDVRHGTSEQGTTWAYQREQRIYRDPISLFVQNYMLFPPPREVHDNRQQEHLQLTFDTQGILKTISHNRSPGPTPRPPTPHTAPRW